MTPDDRITLHHGDCVAVMAEFPPASVDAIITDPPYGLEFMGREWDTFRVDDPGTGRHRGANAGAAPPPDGPASGRRSTITIAFGKRPSTSRCTGCGKRDQFRNDHPCAAGARWATEILDAYAAPPSALAFQNWCRIWGQEALRVAKPGAHLLAFGAPRTYHRLAAGLEDAGWEIRDTVAWLFGSGFPKSMDVSKAIDRAAGASREMSRPGRVARDGYGGDWDTPNSGKRPRFDVPVTAAATEWQGWGTALKPAFEAIVLARKPLGGTVAATVAEHGTGALNIDACRVGDRAARALNRGGSIGYGGSEPQGVVVDGGSGRWPANVVLDEAAAAMLDAAVGPAGGGYGVRGSGGTTYGAARTFQGDGRAVGYGDAGGPSRFFYTAKASTAEREAGLGRGRGPRKNHHPTVKPVALMRWLVRMVTPPGGVVLDPFMGSGSTRIAAQAEAVRFIGIEQDEAFLEIAARRAGQYGMSLTEGTE